ncbi:MAG: dihydrolipoamide acetyltransferase family protein [Armatimonadota bacterium]|nr:dihydrolipoamide acetyltransferase family protein [Armatimonadota bacterium]MDR5688428.1 dihydrolipoamide acetyltransferase family protein [Armatimonadota bacterium]MDR7388945.1 dihydrolipoamide acetyltransferase family protein [Armatimonadota bacterium]MDR7390474.1 dihydrolipoamide acetyltransferase family protein [Armatimonadota bacterium]MDR7394000.1 dihydrolipoamide acetyltransferase family protein [Armatimonadota bacterium]
MPREVIMPALGMAQETGKVLRWWRSEGEEVRQGEPLLEVETDKANVEIESPASGVLARVLAREGDEVPVGQVIGWILLPGEEPSELPAAPVSAPAAAAAAVSTEEVLGPPTVAEPAPVRPRASPKARRLAREMGVDLRSVQGSGPGGAILASDLQRLTEAAPASELPHVWKLMAERTARAWSTVPHFFLQRDVRADRLVAWHQALRQRLQVELTYTDLLVKLVATALRAHPEVNARWEDGRIRRLPDVNVGIAVATEHGLVVPVVHRADELPVERIAQRRAELVDRARAGRLRPEDVDGGTFTISNLGMYGVDRFLAVVNAPQAAILSVGRLADRVVAEEGRPVVRPTLSLGLACDHRVLDGARAARFLETLAAWVEEPLALLDFGR